MFKLIGIMYISISLKNILQLVLGHFFSSETDIKVYKIYNLEKTVYTLKFVILQMFLYDFILFATFAYLWIFLVLYLVVSLLGNKLWFQIGYSLIIYLLTVFYFDHLSINFLFIIIALFLGFANWWMFKKWIKMY